MRPPVLFFAFQYVCGRFVNRPYGGGRALSAFPLRANLTRGPGPELENLCKEHPCAVRGLCRIIAGKSNQNRGKTLWQTTVVPRTWSASPRPSWPGLSSRSSWRPCGRRNNTVSLVASVQFTYFNRPYVQIYSGLDVGVGAHFANTRYEKTYTGEKKQSPGVWLPAFNITPIGVGFGSWPVYGYVETNFGYEGYIKAGLGVHF